MDNNIVKCSFDKLIGLYDKQDEEDEKFSVEDNFCNDECYKKFLNVVNKLKENKTDFGNLNFTDNNVIADLINKYYNQGFCDANINK